MKIFNSLDEINDIKPTIVAVGNFDGVHKGHQEIIKRTVSGAKIAGIKSAVFTFSNHPRNTLGMGIAVKKILYSEDKFRILKEMGIDYLFSIPFDDRIRYMKPRDYIERLLINKLNMQEIYCGFNYRYGHEAGGDVNMLLKVGLEREYGIHIMKPFKIDDHVVSSTMIRELIENGEVDKCHDYLGRHYSIGGEVIVGNKLGKKIGFPTSNLAIDEEMVTPPNGVYVTYCIYNGRRYQSVTNVGVKPTIGEYKKNVETHIFDFDKELYGKNIRVEFLKKTRPEMKFDSIEDLSAQMTRDCINAKAFHRQHRGEHDIED
ncbi:MAG: bifunctional riboflavin kinase/FAD synthetase [Eubacteriaceae bacterium]|nr:bifunctional riboflavin kinase/FAD synthetase [Eubacteriaceae bacterium]